MDSEAPALMWDVLEEHLDEAEFLWGVWERSLVAPDYTLDEVAAGPEARLLAHVDGLVIGGPAVARKLLVPALEEDEPGRVSAAALALLEGPGDAGLAAVVELLREAPTQRPALTRALGCAQRGELRAQLRALLTDDDVAVVAAAAEALAGRDEPIGDALGVLLMSDEPAARALALRAIADEPNPARHLRALQAGLADPEVVDAAIASGVRLGVPAAWALARARAQAGDEASALWLALGGAPADQALLFALLAAPETRAAAVWALGFVGTPAVVDACVEWLDDAVMGPLVGEAFTALTGVELEAAKLTIDGPEVEALAHTPADDLPRPDPMAVMQWWLQHRGRFIDGRRYLAGEPRALAAIVAAIERGPTRRRAGLVLDLQLRCPPSTRPRVDVRAPTSRQRADLATLADLRLTPLELERPLS